MGSPHAGSVKFGVRIPVAPLANGEACTKGATDARNIGVVGSIPILSTVLSRVRVNLNNSRVRDTLSAAGIASVYPLR